MSKGFVSTVAISESKNCPHERSEQCSLSKSSLYKFLSSSVIVISFGEGIFATGSELSTNDAHIGAVSMCIVDSLLCSVTENHKKSASVETSLDGHFLGKEMR